MRQREGRVLRGAPLVSLGLTLLATWLASRADWTAVWELDRARFLAEPWRLLSGHFVHFDRAHFALDALVFLALGAAIERCDRGALSRLLLCAMPLVSLAVLAFDADVQRYRGLSGIDSALFIWLALGFARDCADRTLAWVPVLGFLAKVGFEAHAGGALFLDPGQTYVSVPVAHLAGGLTGALVFALGDRRWQRQDRAHEEPDVGVDVSVWAVPHRGPRRWSR